MTWKLLNFKMPVSAVMGGKEPSENTVVTSSIIAYLHVFTGVHAPCGPGERGDPKRESGQYRSASMERNQLQVQLPHLTAAWRWSHGQQEVRKLLPCLNSFSLRFVAVMKG